MRRIREEKYDLVIADVTQRSLRYGMVARATGAPIRAGFDSDGRGFMYNLRLSLPDQMDFVDCNLQLAAALGAPSTNRQLECFYDASDAEHAEALLAGFGDARPLIAIHPVSNWQSKTWFVHRWANLADELVERLGARVVFVGSARERPYIEAVNRDAAHQHGSLAGMTTLAQLGAVFARADLVISTDSGPRHIASAMQRPQVTLMSSFDLPYRWQFGWPTETVLRTDPACSPCFQNFCSHRQCMAEITEEAVLNACVERLQYRKTA
jgi:3-deoxy-D-manno-octulosonic-acid transferase/heptosyltransferase-1